MGVVVVGRREVRAGVALGPPAAPGAALTPSGSDAARRTTCTWGDCTPTQYVAKSCTKVALQQESLGHALVGPRQSKGQRTMTQPRIFQRRMQGRHRAAALQGQLT